MKQIISEYSYIYKDKGLYKNYITPREGGGGWVSENQKKSDKEVIQLFFLWEKFEKKT